MQPSVRRTTQRFVHDVLILVAGCGRQSSDAIISPYGVEDDEIRFPPSEVERETSQRWESEMKHDPYDVCVAFSDLYERFVPRTFSVVFGGADIQRATRSVLRKARSKRLAVPLKVEPTTTDTTINSFQVDGRHYDVLGAGGTERWAAEGLPLYAGILRYFQAAQPAPKFVRVDTPTSYAQFREARQDHADPDVRLRALETLVSQHVADRHGSRLSSLERDFKRHLAKHPDNTFDFGDYPAKDILGAEVERVVRQLASESTRIPVVKKLQGKVECWQDGDEICCTARFLNPRGHLSLATTATPVKRHLEEALSSADVLELEHVLPVLHRLAQVLGSTMLIPELCRVLPIFSTTGKTSPMIGVMSAKSSPTTAAAMALLQRCQQGDRRAYAEICAMQERGADCLLAEAGERLAAAQCAKAQAGVR